jgi:hypothetical protein
MCTRLLPNIRDVPRVLLVCDTWSFGRPAPVNWPKLFLVIVIGIVAVAVGQHAVEAALVFGGVGSMARAAVVLASSPDKARAALPQGIFQVIAIVLLVIGLVPP